MIPQTYEEWRSCIVNDCKISLTSDFAAKRLNVYQDASNPETVKFKNLYGEQHLNNVIRWLQQV